MLIPIDVDAKKCTDSLVANQQTGTTQTTLYSQLKI